MTVKTGFSGGSGTLHMVKGRKTVCGKDVDGRTWDDPKVIVSCGSCRRTKAYKNAPHDVTDSGEKTVTIDVSPELSTGGGIMQTEEPKRANVDRRFPIGTAVRHLRSQVHAAQYGYDANRSHRYAWELERKAEPLTFNKGDIVLTPTAGYVVITSAVPKTRNFLMLLETSAGELCFSAGYRTTRIRIQFFD